jgi:hypothetical protein
LRSKSLWILAHSLIDYLEKMYSAQHVRSIPNLSRSRFLDARKVSGVRSYRLVYLIRQAIIKSKFGSFKKHPMVLFIQLLQDIMCLLWEKY